MLCDGAAHKAVWSSKGDLHPDKAYLSSPVLGIKNMVLKVARSTHLICDFLDICHHMWNAKFEKQKKVSFCTNGVRFEYGNIAAGDLTFTEVPFPGCF